MTEHPLASIIGAEAFERLVAWHGGRRLYVPAPRQ